MQLKNRYLFALILLLLSLVACNGRSKESLLKEGIAFSRAGNYRGAVVLFKNALEKDPNFFEARYRLADAYLQTGRYELAEKEFLKVQHQVPSRSEITLKLAEVHLNQGHPLKSIAALKSYIDEFPDSSEAYDIMGRAYAVLRKFDKARDALRTAVRLDPGVILPKLHLAQILLYSHEPDAARQLLEEIVAGEKKNLKAYYLLAGIERSQGNINRALELYDELLKYFPNARKAIYLSGLLSLDKGDFPAVAKSVAELKKKFPKSPEGPCLKGLMLYFKKDYAGAEVELLRAIKLGGNLSSYYFLGLSYYQQAKFELALNQFQKTLDICQDFVQARVMVAMTLLKQKRIDDALYEAQKAIAANANNALAHNVLGSAYLAKGKYDEAMEEFDRAIELNPTLADAHLKKGLFSLVKGDAATAENELEEALSVAPEVLNTRILLASFYIRRQNYEAALRTLREGLKGKPSDALLYNYIAAACFAYKKPRQALGALAEAKKVRPDYFTPYFNIASYYISKAQYDKARAEYDEVLAINPKNLKALLMAGALAELQGQEDKALSYFNSAVKADNVRGSLALAQYYLRDHKFSESIAALDAGLAEEPMQPQLLELKGRILAEQGEIEKAGPVLQALEHVKPGRGVPLLIIAYLKNKRVDAAVALAKKIIHSNQKSLYGYVLLSSVYEQQKDYAAAEEVLEKALKVCGENPGLKMRLARLYERTDRNELAMKIYQQLAERDHRFATNALFAQGALNDRLGNKKEALEIYKRVIAKDPKHLASLNNAAYLYAENYNNREKALELAMKAYRLSPSDPGVMDTLGLVLLQFERFDEARRLLEKSARRLPDNPTVLYHLAVARNHFQPDSAIPLLEKALRSSDFPEKDRAEKLLQSIKAGKK